MRKVVIIILAMVVALSALPITFACYHGGWGHWDRFWRPHRTIYCCPTDCNITFDYDSLVYYDVESKDVGDTTAYITDCGKKLVVNITNAYPGYEGIIDFCIKNNGLYPSTITGLTIDNHDPGYLQIDLTGAIQIGTVIFPCTTQCGQLVIGGIPQEDSQHKTFTFDITINFECGPTKCETAYAYHPDYSQCFIDLGYSSWGWTNGPLGPGHYEFQIWAGAAQCDLSKGENIGTLFVDYNGSTVHVYYDITGSDYTMTSTHLYVGSTPIPPNNKPGVPGQYPYKHNNLNNVVTDEYTVPACGPIYIIAHAVACPR